jgi:SNF2 family DNA or RNA helicase
MTDYYEAHHVFNISEDTWHVIQGQMEFSGSNKHIHEIKAVLEEDAFFCKLEDITDIAEPLYIKRIVEMGDEQEKAYRELETKMITEYGNGECSVQSKLTLFIRLQQIGSGFISVKPLPDQAELFEEYDVRENEIVWFKDVPKLTQLYDDIETSSKPVIVVTRFTCEAERIFNDLVSKGYKVCLQTGWKTVGSIEDYQAGKYEIMVANIRVIEFGFNLQNGHSMLFYANTFSLEGRIQTEARIFRMGQKKVCSYIDYISEDTIDMKIVAALKQRRDVMEYIRNVSVKSMLCEWDEVFEEEYSEVYGSNLQVEF